MGAQLWAVLNAGSLGCPTPGAAGPTLGLCSFWLRPLCFVTLAGAGLRCELLASTASCTLQRGAARPPGTPRAAAGAHCGDLGAPARWGIARAQTGHRACCHPGAQVTVQYSPPRARPVGKSDAGTPSRVSWSPLFPVGGGKSSRAWPEGSVRPLGCAQGGRICSHLLLDTEISSCLLFCTSDIIWFFLVILFVV